MESLGASLAADAGWDASTVRLKTLSANAGPAFEILADVTRNPKFDAEEIERHRQQAT